MEQAYIYIISNKNRTVLYIGFTEDIKQRMRQHKSGNGSSFTYRYNCVDLLYFEEFTTIQEARDREKQLKGWHKQWKWNLIKEKNPTLIDLASGWRYS